MKKLLLSLAAAFCAVVLCAGAKAEDGAAEKLFSCDDFSKIGGAALTETAGEDYSALKAEIAAGLESCAAEISIESYEISYDKAREIFWETVYENPIFFYVSSTVGVRVNSVTSNAVGYVVDYRVDTAQVPKMRAEVQEEGSRIVSLMDSSMSDGEKALFLHDYIAVNYGYDSDSGIRNIYDFFALKKGVCQAYALAYEYLMNLCGVPCYYVEGKAGGGDHGWNIVEIDGKHYHVDVTWDDPTDYDSGEDIFSYCGHANFLCSDAQIAATGHNSWSSEYKCDREFSKPIWENAVFPMVRSNDGRWFLSKGTQVGCGRFPEGDVTMIAKASDIPAGPYYIDFMGVGLWGDYLIYNTYYRLYAYNINTGTTELLSSQSSHICGMILEEDGTARCLLGTCRNFGGTFANVNAAKMLEAKEVSVQNLKLENGVLSCEIFAANEEENVKIYAAAYSNQGELLFAEKISADNPRAAVPEADTYKVFVWKNGVPLCRCGVLETRK